MGVYNGNRNRSENADALFVAESSDSLKEM